MHVGLDIHIQVCYEVVMDEKGKEIVVTEDWEYVVEPGDTVHIPAGEVH
jgi:quercetin dioxygenase-like cupin family protein